MQPENVLRLLQAREEQAERELSSLQVELATLRYFLLLGNVIFFDRTSFVAGHFPLILSIFCFACMAQLMPLH